MATQDVDRTQEQLEQLGASGREQGSVDGWTLLQVSGADFVELRGELDGALVGGPDAELADVETAAAEDRQVIFPLVLVLIFAALVVMLRALVAPAIMIASVLLTNIAALGLGWWVSHYVLGERFWWPARPAKNAGGKSPASSAADDADGRARPVGGRSD
ncbi:MMPL family transporter [Corynebacterium confusum]|uniref:MMPL family transporter n=1 Tax=Corynebacterium confusum TaxID=71254 RepID=UPI0025B336D8|nr:MMPL family transporter [Corynebacterium confusum]